MQPGTGEQSLRARWRADDRAAQDQGGVHAPTVAAPCEEGVRLSRGGEASSSANEEDSYPPAGAFEYRRFQQLSLPTRAPSPEGHAIPVEGMAGRACACL